MRNKNLWSLLTIIMITMLTVGFVSCGSDDDDDDNNVKKEETNKKEDNSDLIGWWREVVNANESWKGRIYQTLHFINSNTVETTWLIKASDADDDDPYAFPGWHICTLNTSYTRLYEREENVIHIQLTSMEHENIIMVDNKLRWGSVELEKVMNQ